MRDIGIGGFREQYFLEGQGGIDFDQGVYDNGISIDYGVMGDFWGNINYLEFYQLLSKIFFRVVYFVGQIRKIVGEDGMIEFIRKGREINKVGRIGEKKGAFRSLVEFSSVYFFY